MNITKHPVIYLTRTHAWVHDMQSVAAQPTDYKWDGKTILPLFQSLRAAHADQVRIILGNDISYLTCLSFPTGALTREIVFGEVANHIPEDIRIESFDWKVCGPLVTPSRTIVQAVAAPNDILQTLSYTAWQTGLSIAAVDTVGTLLTTETIGYQSPHIILWSGHERLAVASWRGIIFLCTQPSAETVISDVDTMRTYVHETFNIPIKHLLIEWPELAVSPVTWPKDLSVEKHGFQLLSTLATKRIPHGDDKDILMIRLPSPHLQETIHKTAPVQNSAPTPSTPEHPSNARLMILLGILFLLVLAAAAVILMRPGS